MYFTLLAKKQISLDVNCPAKKMTEAIFENIENPKGFFSEDPKRIFRGDFKDGVFHLNLNGFGADSRPFQSFSCCVKGDEKHCSLEILFKNELLGAWTWLIYILVALLASSSLCKEWMIFPIFFGLMYMGAVICFNINMNKCMDEIEYIINKIIIQGVDKN